MLLQKYSNSGTLLWVLQTGTTSDDKATAIALDSESNLYVGGTTKGAFAGFTNAGSQDIMLQKYSSDGTQLWIQQCGTSGYDYVFDVEIDNCGNVYLLGNTSGSYPGFSNAGGDDIILQKYDKNGVLLWTNQNGTSSSDFVFSMGIDRNGFLYFSGRTQGAYPGYTNNGNNDFLIQSFDSFGNNILVRQTGTTKTDYFSGIAVSTSGDSPVFAFGNTYGSYFGVNQGSADMVLIKLKPE